MGCSKIAHTALSNLPGHAHFELHNLYGQLLAETGTVGLIAWLTFLGVVVSTHLRVRRIATSAKDRYLREFSRPGLEIIGLLVLAGFTGHYLYRYTWLWVAALGDVALALAMRSRRARPTAPPDSAGGDVERRRVAGGLTS